MKYVACYCRVSTDDENVAPLVGAWIEKRKTLRNMMQRYGRSPCGSDFCVGMQNTK